MSKVAIVCDSTGCIPADVIEQLGIHISYISIVFGHEVYREFVDMTPEEFVKKLETVSELPSTTQPTPGATMALYEDLLKNHDEVIHITISSQLSGSYQTSVSCAEMVDANRIHVFDSRTVTFTQGMFGVYAAQKANEGADAKEVLDYLETMRDNNEFYAAIYDLTNLRKGGRLSNFGAALGTLLQIKPICQIQKDGTFQAVEKIRTFKKSMKRLVEISEEAKLTDDYQLVVMHINNEEDAKVLQAQLQEVYPNHTINIYPISLVVAVHGGLGAVGVGWVKHK